LHTLARGFIGLPAYVGLHNSMWRPIVCAVALACVAAATPRAAEREPEKPTTLAALVPPASDVAPVESREELAGLVRAGTRWVEAPELVVRRTSC
jgi:hypothetical protein